MDSFLASFKMTEEQKKTNMYAKLAMVNPKFLDDYGVHKKASILLAAQCKCLYYLTQSCLAAILVCLITAWIFDQKSASREVNSLLFLVFVFFMNITTIYAGKLSHLSNLFLRYIIIFWSVLISILLVVFLYALVSAEVFCDIKAFSHVLDNGPKLPIFEPIHLIEHLSIPTVLCVKFFAFIMVFIIAEICYELDAYYKVVKALGTIDKEVFDNHRNDSIAV